MSAPIFYIHLFWSEDKQLYEPKEDALEIYTKEIEFFVKQNFQLEQEDFIKKNLIDHAADFLNSDLSFPTTFPDENEETFIEFGPSEYFPYSYRTTWKFHDIPD